MGELNTERPMKECFGHLSVGQQLCIKNLLHTPDTMLGMQQMNKTNLVPILIKFKTIAYCLLILFRQQHLEDRVWISFKVYTPIYIPQRA